MMAAAKRSRSGMTLIEAMVAMAILAIITTLVYGGFSQTSRNKTRVETEAEYYHVIRSAIERMTSELSMAYISAHLNPNPSLQLVRTAFVGTEGGNGDRIDFTSFSHRRLYRDAHESDQNEISYFVARDPRSPDKKVLARREQRRVDDQPTKGGAVQILVEDVDDFQIKYLDPASGEWLSTWDSVQGGGQPNRLPSQVKVLLRVRDFKNRRRTKTFAGRANVRIRYAVNHAVYNP